MRFWKGFLSITSPGEDGGRLHTSISHINVSPDAVGKYINGVINNASKKITFPPSLAQFAGPRGTVFTRERRKGKGGGRGREGKKEAKVKEQQQKGKEEETGVGEERIKC